MNLEKYNWHSSKNILKLDCGNSVYELHLVPAKKPTDWYHLFDWEIVYLVNNVVQVGPTIFRYENHELAQTVCEIHFETGKW